MNAITPLNAYFALIVTFAQKYQKDAGVGPWWRSCCPTWRSSSWGGRSFWPRGTSSDFPGGSASLGPIPSVPPGYFDSPPNARSKSARAVQNPRSAT